MGMSFFVVETRLLHKQFNFLKSQLGLISRDRVGLWETHLDVELINFSQGHIDKRVVF